MNRAVLKKCLLEARLLFAACAAALFAFCWVRVYIVSRLEMSQFASIVEKLWDKVKDFSPVPLSQLLSYSGRIALTYDEPIVVLCVSVFAIARGSDAVSGEVNRGTMELLLAQPVARRKVILAHLLVDVTVIPILCAALFAGLHFGVWIVGTFTVDAGVYEALHMKPPNPLPSYTVDANVVRPGLTNMAALLFAVSGYTMWLSAAGRSRTRVLGLAILVTLVQFLVNVIGQLWDGLAFLRPFTVFYYYQPQAINLKGAWTVDPGLAWTGKPLVAVNVVLVLGLVGAVGYAMALRTFVRRDIPAPL